MAGFFSRLKGKDGPSKVKKGAQQTNVHDLPLKPRWEDAWTRKTVEPEEVQQLLRGCTAELKSRGMDVISLSEENMQHSFLNDGFGMTQANFRTCSSRYAVPSSSFPADLRPQRSANIYSKFLRPESAALWTGLGTRITANRANGALQCSQMVLGQITGGVVGWDAYELFKVGETDSNMARDSFATFIPLSVDSDARTKIIFDFFDLLSAIAAHGKTNGLSGRKLSRYAGWWAFEFVDEGDGFEGGYKKWARAADAASHLFFAYLRSLSPDSSKGLISKIPISLQKLVQETEYPPQRPSLLQSSTLKVVMIVDAVSPTPFALLRRANHFQYRDEDRALQEFAEYEDPVKTLTDECRRVLKSISSANQSQVSSTKDSTGLTDASWSRFEDIGFSAGFDETEEDDESSYVKKRSPQGLRTTPHPRNIGLGRPTTPSWADFLSSGFVDESQNGPAPLLLPPDKILPPIDTRGRSSQSHRPRVEANQMEPGELASITRFDLDDSFWWVWISSLAGEEPAERKAAFGRCALIETIIRGGKWLVMEEMVKGAAPAPEEGAYIAEKKSFWGRSKKSKESSRRKSTGKEALEQNSTLRPGFKHSQSEGALASKTSIGPDQHARIQAAAIQLQQKQRALEAQQQSARRGREMDLVSMKTSSVFTLQPVIMSEASPAMKWANKYDKDAIREAYLASTNSGRGLGEATMQTNGFAKSQDTLRLPTSPLQRANSNKDLPPMPSPSLPVATQSPSPQPSSIRYDNEDNNRPRVSDKAIEAAHPFDAHPIERKPVAPQPSVTRVEQPTPEPRESLDQSGSSPENKAKHNRLKKPPQASSGFRKMFGRNKNRKNSDASHETANSALQSGGAALGRRFSGFRKKSLTPAPVTEPAPVNSQRISEDDDTPIASPNHPYDHSYDPSIQDSLSRVDTNDAHEARQAFSSFDQGPLEDVPAFVPEDSPRHSEDDEAALPPNNIAKTRSDEEEPAPTQTVLPAQDRWAQIRKNAAERAAARQSEEQSRGGYSQKTDGDDGETSGEETIESRVARIKARVAELTGNMEGGGSPTSGTHPTRRP